MCNEILKIDVNRVKSSGDSKYVYTDFSAVDFFYTIVVICLIALVQYLLRIYVIFPHRSSIIYFNYIPLAGYLGYFFPLYMYFITIRNYNTYKSDYQNFLYWGYSFYNGRKISLLWNKKKYSGNPYVTSGDIVAKNRRPLPTITKNSTVSS